MPLSQIETIRYTMSFMRSPCFNGETMSMEDVVKLCRELGWPEDKFPNATIQAWNKKGGPVDCVKFIQMFETSNKMDERDAKYRRAFANLDTDGDGKLASDKPSFEKLMVMFTEDHDVSETMAKHYAYRMLKFADQNEDKHISLEEFLAGMRDQMRD